MMLNYEQIYNAFRAAHYDKALNMLIDQKTEELKKPFDQDKNHSWYLVGDALYRSEDYSSALKAFRNSLKYRKSDYQALWALANVYSELRRFKMAERYYTKALSYHPNDKDLIYNLGNALLDQKKYHEALAKYKLINPSDGDVYLMAKKNMKLISNKS